MNYVMAAVVQGGNGMKPLQNGSLGHLEVNQILQNNEDCSKPSLLQSQPQPQNPLSEHQQQGTLLVEQPPAEEPEIDIHINNVVCSFSVRCHLNLRQIALTGKDVEYRRENGAPVFTSRAHKIMYELGNMKKLNAETPEDEMRMRVLIPKAGLDSEPEDEDDNLDDDELEVRITNLFDVMLTMKIRKPYTTASMWSSGKVTCTGATSEAASRVAARRFARSLQKLGFRCRFTNYRIVNVLGTCSMPFAIKITSFSERHREAEYEPELHPGVTYKLKNPKATLKIFSTGSITVTAPSVGEVQRAIETIYPLVYEFRKERTKEDDQVQAQLERKKIINTSSDMEDEESGEERAE